MKFCTCVKWATFFSGFFMISIFIVIISSALFLIILWFLNLETLHFLLPIFNLLNLLNQFRVSCFFNLLLINSARNHFSYLINTQFFLFQSKRFCWNKNFFRLCLYFRENDWRLRLNCIFLSFSLWSIWFFLRSRNLPVVMLILVIIYLIAVIKLIVMTIIALKPIKILVSEKCLFLLMLWLIFSL